MKNIKVVVIGVIILICLLMSNNIYAAGPGGGGNGGGFAGGSLAGGSSSSSSSSSGSSSSSSQSSSVTPNGNFTDVLGNVNAYRPSNTIGGTSQLVDKTSIILTAITNVGMIVSVLIPAILGIKYMIGSIEEKAEYKKDMIPYLVGACLLFGVCTFVKILQSIGNSFNNP